MLIVNMETCWLQKVIHNSVETVHSMTQGQCIWSEKSKCRHK